MIDLVYSNPNYPTPFKAIDSLEDTSQVYIFIYTVCDDGQIITARKGNGKYITNSLWVLSIG